MMNHASAQQAAKNWYLVKQMYWKRRVSTHQGTKYVHANLAVNYWLLMRWGRVERFVNNAGQIRTL